MQFTLCECGVSCKQNRLPQAVLINGEIVRAASDGRRRAPAMGHALRRSGVPDGLGRGWAQGRICFGRRGDCPVLALEGWLAVSGIEVGPVFRHCDMTRYGQARRPAMTIPGCGKPMRPVAVVRRPRTGRGSEIQSIPLFCRFRPGFATSTMKAGVCTLKFRSQTGHASDVMLARLRPRLRDVLE